MYQRYQGMINYLRSFEGLAPLLLRLYLAPIFIKAGYEKLQLGAENIGFFDRLLAHPNVVAWFGNTDWGLGLPMPELLAALAGWTEFLGGWLLLFGFLTRLISLPLMLTMVVAATMVHWDKGWHVLPEAKLTVPWEWRVDLIEEGTKRKERALSILDEHGNIEWLEEAGSITVLKNGIQFVATYFIMLLSLLFTGGGRFTSLDYWLSLPLRREQWRLSSVAQ